MFETSNEQQSQSAVIVVANSTVVVGSMNTSISTANATNHDTVNDALISDEMDNHLNHHHHQSSHHHNGHLNLLSSYYYCKNLIDFPQFHHHHTHYNMNSTRCASNTCSSQHTTSCSNPTLIEPSHLESTSTTSCAHKRFNTIKSTDSNLISLCTDDDLLNDSLVLSANATSRATSNTNISETNNLDENSECSDDSTSACSSSSSTTNSLNSCCGHELIINPCNVSPFDCAHLTSMNELNSNYDTSTQLQSNRNHEESKTSKENNDKQTSDHEDEEEKEENENESDESTLALIKPSLNTQDKTESSNKTKRRRLGVLRRVKMKCLDKNNMSINKSTNNNKLSRVKKLVNYAKFHLNLNLFTKMSSSTSTSYEQLNNTNNLSESIISNASNEQTLTPLSSHATSTSNKFSTLKEKLTHKLRIKRKYSLLSASNNNQISKHRKVSLKSVKMCDSVLNDKSADLSCTFRKLESNRERSFVHQNDIDDNQHNESLEIDQQHNQDESLSSILPHQSTTSISSQIILNSSALNPSASCLPSSSCSPSTSSPLYYFKTDNLSNTTNTIAATTASLTTTSSSSSSSSSSTPTNLNEFISDPYFYNSNNSQNVLVSQAYEQTNANSNNSTNSTQQHFVYDIEMMPINQQSIDEINRTNSSSIYSFMINYPNNATVLNNNATNSSSTGSNSQVKQDLLKMSYDKFKQFRLNEKLLPQTVLIRNAIKMLQYDIQEQESIIFMQNQQQQQQQQQQQHQHMRFQQPNDQQNFLNHQLQQPHYLNSQDNQPQMQYDTTNNLVNYSNCNGANSNNNSMMMMNMNTYENLDEFLSRSEYFNSSSTTSHSLASSSNNNAFANQRANNSSNVIRLTRLANKDSTDSIGCYYINTDSHSQTTHQQHHNETADYEQAMNGEEVDVVCEHLEDDEIEDEDEEDDDEEEEEDENEDEEVDEGDDDDDDDFEGEDDEGNQGQGSQFEENNQSHDHEEHDEDEEDQGNDPNLADNQKSHNSLNNNNNTNNDDVTLEYEQIKEANLVNTNRNRNTETRFNHHAHSDENKENKLISSEFMDAILLSTSTVYVCEADKKYYVNDKYSTVTNNITNNHSLLLFKENENRLNEIVDILQLNLDNSSQNELHDQHNHLQQSADMFFGQSQLNDELMFDL